MTLSPFTFYAALNMPFPAFCLDSVSENEMWKGTLKVCKTLYYLTSHSKAINLSQIELRNKREGGWGEERRGEKGNVIPDLTLAPNPGLQIRSQPQGNALPFLPSSTFWNKLYWANFSITWNPQYQWWPHVLDPEPSINWTGGLKGRELWFSNSSCDAPPSPPPCFSVSLG